MFCRAIGYQICIYITFSGPVSHLKESFRDPLSRQVTEAILITNHRGGPLLNFKSEFFQPSIVEVRQEVVSGLEG